MYKSEPTPIQTYLNSNQSNLIHANHGFPNANSQSYGHSNTFDPGSSNQQYMQGNSEISRMYKTLPLLPDQPQRYYNPNYQRSSYHRIYLPGSGGGAVNVQMVDGIMHFANPPPLGNFPAYNYPVGNNFYPPFVYQYPIHDANGVLASYGSVIAQAPPMLAGSIPHSGMMVNGGNGLMDVHQQQQHFHQQQLQQQQLAAGLPPNFQAEMRNASPENRKQWFDYLLQLSHQKYNSQDFSSALTILQDLYNLDQKHLPTLLLLGCTCYALGIHHLSLFYNNAILAIDPDFAEAHSNLGTTYRAMAQKGEVSPGANNITHNTTPLPQQLIQFALPGTSKPFIELAEEHYKCAINIRPKYWDASINLAGLLSAQNRFKEAYDVYVHIEVLMEQTLICEARYTNPLLVCHTSADDFEYLKLILEIERTRLKIIQSPIPSPVLSDGSSQHSLNDNNAINAFSTDKRRDLYFAKGNLMYALGNVIEAKREYFKGLCAVGLNVSGPFVAMSKCNGELPAGISPQQALYIHQRRQSQPPTEPMFHSTTSSILQTLAKIYQDANTPSLAIAFYYLSLSIQPTANTCNNLGILLASRRLAESIQWYEVGLAIDPHHVHLYTNLGSALKDKGQVNEGIYCYQRAITIQPDFFIALANLANVYKDLGRVVEAIDFYKRALVVKPDFVEAFCNYVNSLLFICEWNDRSANLNKIKDIVDKQLRETWSMVPKGVPTVLPFHTFTYSTLTAWMVREISKRNAERVAWAVTTSDWFPGFPKSLARSLNYPFPYAPPPLLEESDGIIRIGYVSSDFNNHPLAHLMQSVFGAHDRSRFKVYSYSLSPSDNSPYREKIEKESDVFMDVSSFSISQIVHQISQVDHIHILCNLNGYTKGGRNEIFAARPAPVQLAFMGYAGTMGAGEVNDPTLYIPQSPIQTPKKEKNYFDDIESRWIDYLVVDEIACPRKLVCGEVFTKQQVDAENTRQSLIIEQGRSGDISAEDDRNRVYTEGILYMPQTYFVNDHRQGFREDPDPEVDNIVLNNFNLPDCGTGEVGADNNIWLDQEIELQELERLEWRKEEVKRLKMRGELFPSLPEDTLIFANFNQLYKIDPDIFSTWMNIIKRVPNSILWLLRFPPSGEWNLRKQAVELVGEEVASRLVFTDVASKNLHIHRGRIADVFLDTPECNAHTTAADILWSGTPIITYPKYEFKMCGRVAASVSYATGSWPNPHKTSTKHGGIALNLERLKDPLLLGHSMVVNSYQEYEDRAVEFGSGVKWNWKNISSWRNQKIHTAVHQPDFSNETLMNSQHHSLHQHHAQTPSPFFPSYTTPTHIYVPSGFVVDLRRRLFLTRDRIPLFDTRRWVRNLETGMQMALEKYERDWKVLRKKNANVNDGEEVEGWKKCMWIEEQPLIEV